MEPQENNGNYWKGLKLTSEYVDVFVTVRELFEAKTGIQNFCFMCCNFFSTEHQTSIIILFSGKNQTQTTHS